MIMANFLVILLCFGCVNYVWLAPAKEGNYHGGEHDDSQTSTVSNRKESIPEFHSVGSLGNDEGEEVISLHGNETVLHINKENMNPESHGDARYTDESHEFVEHSETQRNLTDINSEYGMVAPETHGDKIEMPDYWYNEGITESVRDLPDGKENHGSPILENEPGYVTEEPNTQSNTRMQFTTNSERGRTTAPSGPEIVEKDQMAGSVRQLPDSNELDPMLKLEGKGKKKKVTSALPEVGQEHPFSTEESFTEEVNNKEDHQDHRFNIETSSEPLVTEGPIQFPHNQGGEHFLSPATEVPEGEERFPHDGAGGHLLTQKPEVTEGKARPPHDGAAGHIPTPEYDATEGEVRPSHDGAVGHLPTPEYEATEGEVRPPHDGPIGHLQTLKPEVTEGEFRPPHDGSYGHLQTQKTEVTEGEIRPPHDGAAGQTPKMEVTEGEAKPQNDSHPSPTCHPTLSSDVSEVRPTQDEHFEQFSTPELDVNGKNFVPDHAGHKVHLLTPKPEVTDGDIRHNDGHVRHIPTPKTPEEKEGYQPSTSQLSTSETSFYTRNERTSSIWVTSVVTRLLSKETTGKPVQVTHSNFDHKNITKIQDKKHLDKNPEFTTEATFTSELISYSPTMHYRTTPNVETEIERHFSQQLLSSVTPVSHEIDISQDRIVEISSINPSHLDIVSVIKTYTGDSNRPSTTRIFDTEGCVQCTESTISPSYTDFASISSFVLSPTDSHSFSSLEQSFYNTFTDSSPTTPLDLFSSQAWFDSLNMASEGTLLSNHQLSLTTSYQPDIVQTIQPTTTVVNLPSSSDSVSTSSFENLSTVSSTRIFTTRSTVNIGKKPTFTRKPEIKTNGTQSTVHSTVPNKSLKTTPAAADLYINIDMKMTLYDFCITRQDFISQIAQIMGNTEVTQEQIMLQYPVQEDCDKSPWERGEKEEIIIQMYVLDTTGKVDVSLTRDMAKHIRPGLQSTKSKFGQKLESVKIVTPRILATAPSDILSEEKSENEKIETGITIAISIAAVGGFCCVCLLILQIIIHKRSGKRMHPHFFESASNRFSMRSMDSVALGVPKSRPHSGFWNHGLELEEKEVFEPSHPLVYSTLTDFASDTDAIHQEFQLIPNETPRLSCVPVGAEDKNRFANVLPFPHTRVKLKKIPGEDCSDYINANYLTGYKDDTRAYIATQAPMSHTAADFWRMVWEQQSRVVLMLTEMDEGGQPRCLPYWPEKTGIENRLSYGDYYIVLKKKEVHQEYIVSVLEIKDIERNLVREIRHFWYTSWPANSTPEPISLVKFVLDTRPYYEDSGAPVIVHCSPGTGRTGTLIAIDICMRSYEDIRSVNILNTVYKMRKERAGAVSTRDQYNLIYKAVCEYAVVMNTPTSVSTTSSVATLQNML